MCTEPFRWLKVSFCAKELQLKHVTKVSKNHFVNLNLPNNCGLKISMVRDLYQPCLLWLCIMDKAEQSLSSNATAKVSTGVLTINTQINSPEKQEGRG
jgi:hypothetical protein